VLAAASIVLAVAGCTGHITPLGPDQAATIPQPHHLRSPLILQAMPIQQPAPASGCPAGSVTLPGGGSPGTCYRTNGKRVTITSTAVSPVSPFQPPPPPGQQQPVPVQYVFWMTVPAADVPALTAVTTTVTGPQRPQQGPPTASAATSELTISVAGRTWVLVGFATRFTGREFEAALPSRNQALQLQHTLAASG
jgi:hypothetical protein